MTPHDFGDFRSLLDAPVSFTLRDALWELIGDEGQVSQELLAYLLNHVKRWPTSLKRSPASTWEERAERGEDVPALMLCSHAHLVEHRCAWLASPYAASVHTLTLSSELTPETMAWFSENVEVPEVRTITAVLRACPGADTLAKLARWPGLAHVRCLDFSFSSLDDDGLSALVRSPYTRSIETLTLTGSEVRASSVQALMASRRMGSLRRIDLRYCSIGSEGAVALASGKNAAKLEWLHVGMKDVTSKGVTALKRSTVLPEHIRDYYVAVAAGSRSSS